MTRLDQTRVRPWIFLAGLILAVGCSSSTSTVAERADDGSRDPAGAEVLPEVPAPEPAAIPDADIAETAEGDVVQRAFDGDAVVDDGLVADYAGSRGPASLGDQPESDDPSTEVIEEVPYEPYAEKSPAQIAAEQAFEPPSGATRLAPDANLWVDGEHGRVIVDGYVALREGPLEMFACPVGTKEHESVVAVLSPARHVHAALLAVGAKQGTPVAFIPDYRPATGQRIAVWVLWRDADGQVKKARAQQWVKKTGTEEPLALDWVFAGSSFWKDPETGTEYYQADSGDLICVSNFTTATLDLPVESSQSNSALQYSAFTENIPPRGTPVRLVLVPIPLPSDAEEEENTQADPSTPPEDALALPAG